MIGRRQQLDRIARSRIMLCALAATFALPAAAYGSPAQFNFTGIVFSSSGVDSSVFPVGSTITGSYFIDITSGTPSQSALPVSLTSNWSSANYNGSDYGLPPNSAYVFASFVNNPANNFAYCTTGYFNASAGYFCGGSPSGTNSSSSVQGTAHAGVTAGEYTGTEANVFGTQTVESYFQLISTTGDPFDINGLPIFATGTTGQGFFTEDLSSGVVQYQITSLTAVPLPGAGWLLVSGLGLLALGRRQLNHAPPQRGCSA